MWFDSRVLALHIYICSLVPQKLPEKRVYMEIAVFHFFNAERVKEITPQSRAQATHIEGVQFPAPQAPALHSSTDFKRKFRAPLGVAPI